MSYTAQQMKEAGYFEADSPVKGLIYTKQNGEVIYMQRDNVLQLPNGNTIQNPTQQDLTNDYSSFVGFRPLGGCSSCKK